jgi:ferric-dicitrate binding protein FerR (iron transport regulator)
VLLDNGEGFFDVSRSSGVPFIVRSGRVETRVLGTSFLVRHFGRDGRVHVAVSSGKVNVAGAALGDSLLSLTTGRVGDITDSLARASTVVDDAPEAAFEDGQMVFRHAPVAQVLTALERWYGYRFRCADSAMTQLRVTVWMSTRSSAAALAKLEQILSVNLTVVGDTVTLTPHAAQAERNVPRARTYDMWTPDKEVGR